MKKILPLLIFNLILFQCIKSQSWCPPGATWYPGVWSGLFGYDAIVEYKYTHDTLIQNKNCKIIKGTFIGQNLPDFGTLNYTIVPNYRTYYTYENNNTVYLFQNNYFDTVVNFDAQFGDKWRLPSCSGGNPNRSVTITDTGHVIINNLSLKSLTASYTIAVTTGTTTQTYTLNYIFTERVFGSLVRWGDLFGRGCFDIPHDGELNSWPQNCGYKDNDISTLSTVEGFCSKFTALNEFTNQGKLGFLYPNPNAGDFTIALKEASMISIYDSFGSLKCQISYNEPGNVEISIRELPNGFYYLKVQVKSETYFQKFLKQ